MFSSRDGNRIHTGNFTLNKESPQARGLVGWWPNVNKIIRNYADTSFPDGFRVGNPRLTVHPQGGRAFHANIGENQYINCGALDELVNGSEGFTAAIWIKSDTASGNDDGFYGKTIQGNDDDEFSMRYDSAGFAGGQPNVLKLGLTTSSGVQQVETSANSQTTNVQHVLMRWNGKVSSSIEVLIDGKLDVLSHSGTAQSGTVLLSAALDYGFLVAAKDSWQGIAWHPVLYNRYVSDAVALSLFHPATRWDLYHELGLRTYFFMPPGPTPQALAAVASATAAFSDVISRFRAMAALTTAAVVMNKSKVFVRFLAVTTTAGVTQARGLDLSVTLAATATTPAVMPTPIKSVFTIIAATAGTTVTALVVPVRVLAMAATAATVTSLATLATFFRALTSAAVGTAGLSRLNSFFRTLTASGTGVAAALPAHINLLAIAATAVATAAISRLLVQGVNLVATATGVAAAFTFKFTTAVALAATAVGTPVFSRFAELSRRLAVQARPVVTLLIDGVAQVTRGRAGWSQLVRNKVSRLFIIRR